MQIFISLYSPYLCDSIARVFVPNGSVFIELYANYYTSTQNCPFLEKNHTATVITGNPQPHPSKPVPLAAGTGKLGLGYG